MKNSMKTVVGVAMVAAFVAVTAPADITYVDLTTSNTEEWDGAAYGVFTTSGGLGDQGPSGDGKWDVRAFANDATVYQNAGTSQLDDAARLKMTVSGLPSETYNVFAYFWSDNSPTWTLTASLTDNPGGDLPLFSPANADEQWYTGGDATVFSDSPSVNGGVNPFTSAVMVGEGNRRLYQVNLGQVTGTEVSVYLDDWSGATAQNQRTWVDGIGYEVVPEPGTLGMFAIFGIALLVFRRSAKI